MKKKILAIQGSSLKKVNIETDTTIFLAMEAQKKGYQIYYFEPKNLSFLNGKVKAECAKIKLFESSKVFYKIIKKINLDLVAAKIILIEMNPLLISNILTLLLF